MSQLWDSHAGGLPCERSCKRWLAVYTRARHEQKACQYYKAHGFEVFFPTYHSWRNWSDRRKLIELPLFPSYLFINIAIEMQSLATRAPGFLWFVRNQFGPIAVDDSELMAVRCLMDSGLAYDPLPAIQIGEEVMIRYGALAGHRGKLIRKHPGTLALVLSAINGGVRVFLPDPTWVQAAAH